MHESAIEGRDGGSRKQWSVQMELLRPRVLRDIMMSRSFPDPGVGNG